MDETKHYPVMFEQQRSDHLRALYWRQPPYIPMSDRPPPGPGTYLVSCRNADGRKFVALKYWAVPANGTQFEGEPYWADAGPYVTVEAWTFEPAVWDGIMREASSALAI